MDRVYADQQPPLESSPEPTTTPDTDLSEDITPFPPPNIEPPPSPDGETMLLSQANAKRMTKELNLPALEVELERAIWQVETAIRKRRGEEQKEATKAGGAEKSGEAGTGVEMPRPADGEDKKTR